MISRANMIAIVSVAVLTTGIYSGASYVITRVQALPKGEMLQQTKVGEPITATEDIKVERGAPPEISTDMKSKYLDAHARNSDIVGWIHVPDTNVNYPICSGDDNFYLNYNSDKQKSRAGSIFLDDDLRTFSDVSLVHGHNMRNQTMFSTLKKFKDLSFFKSHNVYLYDGSNTRTFRPIGFIRVGDSTTFNLNLHTPEEIEAYAKSITASSIHPTVEGINGNNLLLLNTCVSDGSNDHFIVVTQEVL